MNGRSWTEEENQLLQKHYSSNNSLFLQNMLNRTARSIYHHALQLGLKKDKGYLQSKACGRIIKGDARTFFNRFPKGNKPWNKGLKGLDIGGKETRFKKGQRPATAHEINTVIIRQFKDDPPYKFICVEGSRAKLYHRYLWEQKKGKIPAGFILACKTADTLNADPDNWEMISRAENMLRKSMHRYPLELQTTLRTISKIKKVINEKQNK